MLIDPSAKKELRIGSCVDEETMACYIDNLLLKEEGRQVEKHIATCDRCKEIVNISRKIKNQEEKGLLCYLPKFSKLKKLRQN